jgi:hypothetical protein
VAVPFPLRSQPYPSAGEETAEAMFGSALSTWTVPDGARMSQVRGSCGFSRMAPMQQPNLDWLLGSATLRQWPDGLNPAPEPPSTQNTLSIRSVHLCTSASALLS